MMNVGVGELLLCALILVIPLAAVLGIVLLVKGTKEKSQFGINFTPPSACPKCGEPLPAIRAPTNLRQAMWGGWTCAKCGVELDKWGRVLG